MVVKKGGDKIDMMSMYAFLMKKKFVWSMATIGLIRQDHKKIQWVHIVMYKWRHDLVLNIVACIYVLALGNITQAKNIRKY